MEDRHRSEIMTLEDVTLYAMRFPEVTEEHPFGETTHVYKVAGRIFAFAIPDLGRPRIALKCEPGLATLLRGKYVAVTPGYHLNKRHWNTILLNHSIPSDEIREMIYHSYEMVVAKMTKATQVRLLSGLENLEELRG